MKKLLSALLAVLVCFSLSGCSLSSEGIKSNLEDAGYSIIEMDADQLEEMNNQLTYNYRGDGSIITGFYAVNNETKGSVTVVEFEYKDDLTLMYKIAEESINSETEAVDLSGNILIFGAKDGVKAALN